MSDARADFIAASIAAYEESLSRIVSSVLSFESAPVEVCVSSVKKSGAWVSLWNGVQSDDEHCRRLWNGGFP